jgi:two-component system, LytTR family, sensor kinase
MLQPTNNTGDTHPSALKEALEGDKLQRLINLDKLASQLVFTDISKAQKFLAGQMELLKELDEPDYELNYHLNTALIENLLYNYDLAEQQFQTAIEILNERGDISQLAEAYIDYAGTLLNIKKVDKAKELLGEATRFLKNFPDDRLQARLVCRQGYLELDQSNTTKALENFLEAEKRIYELGTKLDIKDQYFITLIQSGLGTIYAHNEEPEKSILAYKVVVELCEKMGMKSRLSWHYLNVGNGYMSMKNYESGIHYFKLAIRALDDVNQQARASAYANLGYCYLTQGKFKEALRLLTSAYPLFIEDRHKNLANIEWWRAKVYDALYKRKKGLKYYFRALDLAKKAGDNKQISGILKDIANWYADGSDFKNAYDYQKFYEQAIERSLMEAKDSEIRELEIKYEAEKKENEAEMFKLQAIGLQLKALRAQMNPHFLFNALNSVQHFITSKDNDSATKYLAQFAYLMRQSLEFSNLEVISLEEEIEFLKQYLEINEKLRFEHKLTYKVEVDEEIEEDIYGVPSMIIQPYVENAIEHGIRPKENGLVAVSFALKDEDTILCTIEDNGIGREKARKLQESDPNFKKHRSLGTKITEDRLKILLNSRGSVDEVVKIIDLKDNETGEALGTRVEVLIPIIEIQVRCDNGSSEDIE